MCSACEAGEYAVANCTATADRQCGACPAGRFQPDRNEDSECEACHVCDAGFNQTTACTSTTDTECFPCPTGKYSVGDGTGCVDCPAGTFSDQAPLASEGDCSECDPGYYQPECVSSHTHLNPFFCRLLFTLAVCSQEWDDGMHRLRGRSVSWRQSLGRSISLRSLRRPGLQQVQRGRFGGMR